MPTMLQPKFRRSPSVAWGRPSPRAVDEPIMSPEQAKQIGEAAGKVGGAILDTLAGMGRPPPPPPPKKKDHTPLLILAGAAVLAFVLLRRRRG